MLSVQAKYTHWILGLLLYSNCIAAHAQTLLFEKSYHYVGLPDSILDKCSTKNNCPELNIVYANSNQKGINATLNQAINGFILNVKNAQAPSTVTAQVEKALLDFAQSQLDDIPEESSLNYQLSAEPDYLGHINQLELFVIYYHTYLGGAHGLPHAEYFIFDGETSSPLTLNDLLLPKQKKALTTLVYNQFKAWVAEQGEVLSEYEKFWSFEMTDNITLNERGLVFMYSPYHIAPYAAGMPELVVPYQQLKGIVKPQYLILSK